MNKPGLTTDIRCREGPEVQDRRVISSFPLRPLGRYRSYNNSRRRTFLQVAAFFAISRGLGLGFNSRNPSNTSDKASLFRFELTGLAQGYLGLLFVPHLNCARVKCADNFFNQWRRLQYPRRGKARCSQAGGQQQRCHAYLNSACRPCSALQTASNQAGWQSEPSCRLTA